MTGSLDVQMRIVASEIISELGKSITWNSTTFAYPATTGTSIKSEISYVVDAAIESYDIALVDGSTILATDIKLIIAANALGFEPTIGDSVVIDDQHALVLDVAPIIGGSVIVWEAQCRK